MTERAAPAQLRTVFTTIFSASWLLLRAVSETTVPALNASQQVVRRKTPMMTEERLLGSKVSWTEISKTRRKCVNWLNVSIESSGNCFLTQEIRYLRLRAIEISAFLPLRRWAFSS